jgi:peptide/nickel transport system substrate-binding protein
LIERLQEPTVLSHFVNTSSEFDLVVPGETAELVARINRLLRSDAGKEALGSCTVAESFPVFNEPENLFRVRRGVHWHDGKPFTAGDVEFTYRMIMDEEIASPRRADYELVRNVELTDDYTVRIVYRKPYAPCLGSWGMGMLPKHILDGHKSAWWAENFNRSPVGTGPFKFDRWVSNQYIRLRRNDDYWEGKPHLDYITIRTIPDMVALRLLFESGEIDFWGVDPHASKKFLDDPEYDVFQRPSPSYNYIGWNLKRPVFQDVRVRQALAHAVNVPEMIKYIMYGQGEPSTGPFPPQMWYANPNVTPFDYDPAKAEAMLDEAGWRRGPDGIRAKNGQKFEFTLITNHPNEIRKDMATLVQSDLKKIGIKVDVQLYEWAVFISEYINKQDFDAMVLGWSLGYDYDQYQLWHSSQTKPGMLNHCSYVNHDVDRWMELARSEFDQDKAREVLWKLHRQIYEDQPYLFLFVPMSAGAMRKGVFRVRRPDGKGGWVDEEVRSTKLGFRVYQDWWYRVGREP